MILSGSTKGQGISVAATSSGGTVIDTRGEAPEDGIEAEEFGYYFFAVNNHDSDVLLTVEFGGTAANNLIEKTIKAGEGLVTVVNGLKLAAPIAVTAFAATADKIMLYGDVRRA
tara:strand:- start:4306 stop:4647 length:342 start_codon:yes stop_codon:yes gene_type:complete